MRKAHPNLNRFYFKEINTKEKAYWLGFLYADGCVIIDRRSNSKRIRISSNIKDENLIDKFCKAIKSNREKKEYYKKVVRLTIWSNNLANDLINWGCKPRKSKVIALPKLDNRSLYLAFLLGFFDGDGTQSTTRITSGSYIFLEQIKNKFNLKFKISKIKSKGIIEGKEFHGTGYVLCLGADLFNEMLDNYSNSLLRKRKRFCSEEQRIEKIRDKCNGFDLKGKLSKISKQELENLVWTIPTVDIAKLYAVSDTAIAKQCKKFGISKPPRGYWNKIRAQKNDKF